MSERLPDLIDLWAFVEKKRRIKGSLPLSRMDRLSDLLLNPAGEAQVDLSFGREDKVAVVEGRVEADLTLQCQCCLEALPWPVRSEVRLGLASSIDEANRLPDEYEPLLVPDEGVLPVADIVQDELLLAIPSIPRHPQCVSPEPDDRSTAAAGHPFAALAQLKTKLSSE
jgi:uncharacterized protein